VILFRLPFNHHLLITFINFLRRAFLTTHLPSDLAKMRAHSNPARHTSRTIVTATPAPSQRSNSAPVDTGMALPGDSLSPQPSSRLPSSKRKLSTSSTYEVESVAHASYDGDYEVDLLAYASDHNYEVYPAFSPRLTTTLISPKRLKETTEVQRYLTLKSLI
jgi:hypothetical protein